MKTRNIFLLLFVILLNGCLSEKHLDFMNVPLDGDLDKFVNELVLAGFSEPHLTEGNQVKLNGVFLNKKSEIYVYATPKSNIVYSVRVNLPGEVHDSLEYSYGHIQKLYTSEYGKGTSKYLQFQNSSRFLFNEPKFNRHISIGDFTRYTTRSGEIKVEVQTGYISITYLDKLNNEIMEKESR